MKGKPFTLYFASSWKAYVTLTADLPWGENTIVYKRWCNDLAIESCIFVLDRFGDFTLGQVVAPVRETVSEILASLLHIPLHFHGVLLQMVRRNFPIPVELTNEKTFSGDKSHMWEVRHASCRASSMRSWGTDVSGMDVDDDKEVLRGVIDAAVLG